MTSDKKDSPVKKRKNEDSARKNKNRKKFKYENGVDVPSDMQITSEGKGRTKKYFALNIDGTKDQVFLPDTLRQKKYREGRKENNSITVSQGMSKKKKYKYENGEDVPSDIEVQHEGNGCSSRDYVINLHGEKERVFSERTFYDRKEKDVSYYYEDGRGVESDVKVEHKGRGHFVLNSDGLKIKVITKNALRQRINKQRKHFNDNSVISDEFKGHPLTDVVITQEDSIQSLQIENVLNLDFVDSDFSIQNENNEIDNFHTNERLDAEGSRQIKVKKYKYANGEDVGSDIGILHDNQRHNNKHYVLNPDGSMSQVFIKDTFEKKNKNNILLHKDGRIVSPDAKIEHEARKHYISDSNGTREQVFTARSLQDKKSMYYEDGRKVPDNVDIYCNDSIYYVINQDGIPERVLTKDTIRMRKYKLNQENNNFTMTENNDQLRGSINQFYQTNNSQISFSNVNENSNNSNINALSPISNIEDTDFYKNAFSSRSSPLLFGSQKEGILQQPSQSIAVENEAEDVTQNSNLVL